MKWDQVLLRPSSPMFLMVSNEFEVVKIFMDEEVKAMSDIKAIFDEPELGGFKGDEGLLSNKSAIYDVGENICRAFNILSAQVLSNQA